MSNEKLTNDSWAFCLMNIASLSENITQHLPEHVREGDYDDLYHGKVTWEDKAEDRWYTFNNKVGHIRYLIFVNVGVLIIEPYSGGTCDVFMSQSVRDHLLESPLDAILDDLLVDTALDGINGLVIKSIENKASDYVYGELDGLKNYLMERDQSAISGFCSLRLKVVTALTEKGIGALDRYEVKTYPGTQSSSVILRPKATGVNSGAIDHVESWVIHHCKESPSRDEPIEILNAGNRG